jgi:hypothetical protein
MLLSQPILKSMISNKIPDFYVLKKDPLTKFLDNFEINWTPSLVEQLLEGCQTRQDLLK